METIDFLASLEHESGEMLDIVRRADLDAPVPTCPGWTVRDLVVHTGIVHRHKTATVRDKWIDGQPPRPDEPSGNIIDWFAEGIDAMLTVFGDVDLAVPTWTWCDHQHDAMWWVRRMAHETLIHRADATIAMGRTPVVDEMLATDGIEEILVEMMSGAPDWATLTAGSQTIEILTPGGQWMLRTATWSGKSPRERIYEDEPAIELVKDADEPGAVVAGAAADLDLWLWGRAELPDESVEGDQSLVDLVRSVAAEATQ
jgi:uncharacterized protein (TIGR03083 family)